MSLDLTLPFGFTRTTLILFPCDIFYTHETPKMSMIINLLLFDTYICSFAHFTMAYYCICHVDSFVFSVSVEVRHPLWGRVAEKDVPPKYLSHKCVRL